MVAKTAEPQLTPLEKENAEMKRELALIYTNQKLNAFTRGIVWLIIMEIMVSYFAFFAETGGDVVAATLSPVGGALLMASLVAIGLILKVWIVIQFIADVGTIFRDDIRTGGITLARKIKIFVTAGRNAVRENEETEEGVKDLETKVESVKEPAKITRNFQKQQEKDKASQQEAPPAGSDGHPVKGDQKLPL
jgi:hypothetical protein